MKRKKSSANKIHIYGLEFEEGGKGSGDECEPKDSIRASGETHDQASYVED